MSFKIVFETPRHGWMEIHVSHEEHEVVFDASYVWTSLYDLMTSLSQVLAGTSETSMRWELEPIQLWFEFSTKDGVTTLNVIEGNQSSRIRKTHLSVTMNSIKLCLIFWRALRKWQTQPETFLEGWQRPFPDEPMNRFTEQLEAARKASKSFRRKSKSDNKKANE